MGQVAASTAVLAFKNKTTPLSVPVKDIKTLLMEHGAIVPA